MSVVARGEARAPRPGFGSRIRLAALAAPLAMLAMAGCRGQQSMFDPAGPQAERIERLAVFAGVISTAVFIAVLAATAWAVLRRRRGDHAPASPDRDRRMGRTVAWLTGGTVAVLFVWLLADFGTQRAMAKVGGTQPLKLTVTGHQWWWEVQYEDTVPQNRLVTANEIHIPVGRPVLVKLEAPDVIHSFWVPRLHGKRDLIPGYTNHVLLRADRPGRFRGQCAEFCGMQHAHMSFWVVAESPAKFDAWYRAQLRPAAAPADSTRRAGQTAFMSNSCAMCHAIRGTAAGAGNGPDLTHVGSRMSLASGTIANVPGHLGGWVVDPQSIKPGTQMPPNQLKPEELRALIAYLEGLK
ncbi:MAG TPA: cytochrome c oxidase subunit II [Longimicrobiaceae bacterium]|jgi:cytochrome c oxidase subunit 2|nr:cytochrome c oxidase subunit II [Longimicrobiaceae bacterium]